MTNPTLLSLYSSLITGYLKDEINAQEFAEKYNRIDEETKNSGEFLTLPYLKQQLKLNDAEYLVLIIATTYEINGALPNIKTPAFAHAMSIVSEICNVDYGLFELFKKGTPFSKLWRQQEETAPLISAPLALKKEAVLFII